MGISVLLLGTLLGRPIPPRAVNSCKITPQRPKSATITFVNLQIIFVSLN